MAKGDPPTKKQSCLAVIAVMLACGVLQTCGDSSRPATTTTSPPASTSSSNPPREQGADKADLEDYLYNNFGGAGNPEYATTWYDLIESVSIVGDTVKVNTGIYPDADGERLGNTIAGAVMGWDGYQGYVLVYASNGTRLAKRP